MRTGALLSGLGGLVTAAAAAGQQALIGVGVIAMLLIILLCWTVSNRSRTRNLVSIILALRSAPRRLPSSTRPEPLSAFTAIGGPGGSRPSRPLTRRLGTSVPASSRK